MNLQLFYNVSFCFYLLDQSSLYSFWALCGLNAPTLLLPECSSMMRISYIKLIENYFTRHYRIVMKKENQNPSILNHLEVL